MRSTLSLGEGGGEGGGLRARLGRMKRLLGLRRAQRVDVLTDMEPGVCLRRFQLVDTEGYTEDPVQEWGEEVEEDAVFGITLRREPVLPIPFCQDPSDPLADSSSTPLSFIQYRTVKVRRLKAGTLERLVSHLLDTDHLEPDYIRMFLSTYRAFTTTTKLIKLLFQKEDMMANLDSSVCPRSTLLPLIRTWLEEYGEDFRDSPKHTALRLLCVHLCQRLAFRRIARIAETLLKKFQEEDNSSLLPSPPMENSRSEPEVDGQEIRTNFLDFPMRDIAEQLTRLDSELFVRVVPFQCLGCIWSQRDKKDSGNVAPTVRATIAQFNAVTNRVITSLLCPSSASPTPVFSSPTPTAPSSPRQPNTSPGLRARAIEWWIAVAQECRMLKNFSSLRAILSALQSNAVYRLKKTWAAVNKDCVACFDQLCEMFPDENCVLTSREILVEDDSQQGDSTVPRLYPMPKQLSSTCGVVPYLGTYLTVLTMLDTALPDQQGGLINFEKRRREFEILSQIAQLQASCSCYRFPVDQTISSWLQNHTMLSDQEGYELSRVLEPPVDPCPNSPSSWSQRIINKKLAMFLSVRDVSSRKTHSDQISVSSSGSSSSDMDDISSPQCTPLRGNAKTLSGSLHNVADTFASSSPAPSTCSSTSQPDLSTTMSPDCSFSSSSSSSSSCSSSAQCWQPVYNKQIADSCIVRVSVECGDTGNIYKSILLTSQDHTPQVIQRALEKHNLEEISCSDFSLTQLLGQDKEFQIPDNVNVFYAMATSANYDFVLRHRWGSYSRNLGSSSSPGPQARGRQAK
ncbi:hypothetical protein UPYG_G00064200 [Umbra pygmaea]|uniref:Ral guanine nucleotide dissociation stimulator-like 1 n=1 Tax=Umbra pygmaea TaxID=75934 RepID=A0ABD0XAK4_UMBPY